MMSSGSAFPKIPSGYVPPLKNSKDGKYKRMFLGRRKRAGRSPERIQRGYMASQGA